MRKNSVQCDACCKTHPVDDEYDVSHLPGNWYTVIPGQGGGFKETMHFCSTKCSLDWLEKQTIVLNDVIEHDVYPDPSAMTKAETILKWIERTKEEIKEDLCGDLPEISRLSVLVDDIEELCREEVSPDKLELWKEVKIVRAEMIEKKDEYWRDL